MKWYCLVREGRIINEVQAENVHNASYIFRHDKSAKVGDQIMVCVLKAVPMGDWEWKA